MARALKVFCYSDGFHAWTVATTSRAKALAAWGVERDLFADGSAREVKDSADREAALARPGELIERGLTVDVGQAAPRKTPKAKAPSAKARAKVEALKAELAALNASQGSETAALRERSRALDAEAAALDARHAKAAEALEARLKAAKAKLD